MLNNDNDRNISSQVSLQSPGSAVRRVPSQKSISLIIMYSEKGVREHTRSVSISEVTSRMRAHVTIEGSVRAEVIAQTLM
jgi:hypothetical protein